jgi:hypothetical protein
VPSAACSSKWNKLLGSKFLEASILNISSHQWYSLIVLNHRVLICKFCICEVFAISLYMPISASFSKCWIRQVIITWILVLLDFAWKIKWSAVSCGMIRSRTRVMTLYMIAKNSSQYSGKKHFIHSKKTYWVDNGE